MTPAEQWADERTLPAPDLKAAFLDAVRNVWGDTAAEAQRARLDEPTERDVLDGDLVPMGPDPMTNAECDRRAGYHYPKDPS